MPEFLRNRKRLWRRLKTGARWFAVFIAGAGIAGFLSAWSGLYSVAASRGHWPGFSLFLEFAMRSSVRTHALVIRTPDLVDPALARRGAGHYQGGCAPCHGAPGQPANPVALAMLPPPPELGATVPSWKPKELFWIVKNGLKYTGMPAWSAQQRDDEVWAITAFLQVLPQMDAAHYRGLAGLEPAEPIPVRTLAQGGPAGTALAACSRCHGMDGRAHPGGAFPRLDIQPAEYLFTQLQDYKLATRHSGIMQPVAAELDTDEMRRLADYYASVSTAQPLQNADPAPENPLGRTLAEAGLPDLGLPACLSCHAQDPALRDPLYPALLGQYASYLSQQLRLFKTGMRGSTAAAQIMNVIAERLSDEQIEAVSHYLAESAR